MAATPAAVFVFSRRADYAAVISHIALWEVFVRHLEHAQSFPARGRRQLPAW
jgi:hypothetical protein